MEIDIVSRSPNNKEATHIAVHVLHAFLYKMILGHGCPQEIVSDQGREFCNKLVDSLEDLTGFKHIHITHNRMGLMRDSTKHWNPSCKSLSMTITMIGITCLKTFYLHTDLVVMNPQSALPFFWCMDEMLVYQLTELEFLAMLMSKNLTLKQKSRRCWSCKRSYTTKFEITLRMHRPVTSGNMMPNITPTQMSMLVTKFYKEWRLEGWKAGAFISWWSIRNNRGFRERSISIEGSQWKFKLLQIAINVHILKVWNNLDGSHLKSDASKY